MRQDDDERTQDLPPGGGPAGRGASRNGQQGPSSFGGLVPEDTDTFPPLGGAPDLFPNYRVRQPPPPKPPRNRGPLIAVISVVALVAVVGGVLYTSSRVSPSSGIGRILGCGDGSPCQAAESYLNDYTSGNYEAMYGLTSSASRQRFSDAKILNGNYKDAHDYIVNRTKGIISAAQITSISGSSGDVKQSSDTAATVPARLVYNSARVGTFTEDVTIPLVNEQGTWHVTWTPGLIFPQMDDQADPYYQRKVRLSTAVGQRGTIYDRDNNVLAKDDTVYQIGVVPAKIGDEGKLLQALGGALDMKSDDIKAAYQGNANTFHLIRTVPPQLYNQISQTLNNLPGVQVNQTTGRVYPYGADLAAVTGYVSIIQPDDLKNDKDHYYDNGDLVGHTGIEAWGEQYLRPIKGGALKIVNANADGSDGSTAYTVASRDAANGDDIHTAINLANQEAAFKGLATSPYQGNSKGSGAFAVDPATGEVLVMASVPACDPNDFALQFNNGIHGGINACLDNPKKPLNNYALSAPAPTGSIFKIVTLAAGLENGVSATDLFTCKGSYQIPGQSKPSPDDLATGHGTLTAPAALAPSCDVIYWQVALKVGDKDPTLLPKMGKAFGYGAPTGIVGVPAGDDNGGLMPDPDYLQHRSPPANWAPIDSANLGIGQGFFQATIAQVTMASAAVGNNGVRMQPRLVTSITSGSAVIQTFDAKQVGTLPLTPDHLAVVQAAMAGSTYGEGTSAAVFKNYPISVAGKTGTAQSCDGCQSHSWFTVYAPYTPASDTAKAAQFAGTAAFFYLWTSGGAAAAPVTRAMMNAQFKLSGQ